MNHIDYLSADQFNEHDFLPIHEKAILEALEKRLNDAPPFSRADVRRARSLILKGLRNGKELGLLTDLRSIRFKGCDIVDLSFMLLFPRITIFRCCNTPFCDVSPLRDLTDLSFLSLDCCRVEDISPLLEMPQLRRVELVGNPLTERSYFELLPRLEEMVVGQNDGVLVHSQENEWRITRELHERGLYIAFTCNSAPDSHPYVQAVGMEHTDNPSWDGVKPLSEALMRKLLEDPDLTVPKILAEARRYTIEEL